MSVWKGLLAHVRRPVEHPTRCPFMRLVRAFTIIELLVVIAIIGVLTGILLPALAKARKVAATTRELSAGQSLAQAYALYAGENRDEVLPGYVPVGWVLETPAPGSPVIAVFDQHSERVYGTQAQRYPWRLLPTLGYDMRGLYKDEGLLKEYQQRSDYQYIVSLSPSFGLNSMFVGGDSTLDRRGFNAVFQQQFGSFYITRTDQPMRPSELIVFATSHGVNPDGGELVPGFFRIDPPIRATGTAWWSGLSESAVNPGATGFVDYRHGGAATRKAATVHFDGHAGMFGYDDLNDMRRWADRATRADWWIGAN